jgi:glycosyltransferase involved in cell wall biosynthesis
MRTLAGTWSSRLGATFDRSAPVHALRTRVLARNVEIAEPLDAVLAMGTEMYGLHRIIPVGLRCYTFDDGTLAQMWRHPYSNLRTSAFRPASVCKWIHYQQESCRRADACFVTSSWAAASLIGDYGVHPSRVEIVGIGHKKVFGTTSERDWSRPRYLFVGIDWQRKNGAAVVNAFRRVRDVIPDATLHLVGGAPVFNEPGIVNHGLLSKGDPVGQELLRRLYASATCFVLPSRFEPAGIAYLEAGSAGLPVICTSEGGASELLGSGSIAVDPADVGAITQAMLLLSDPAVAKKVGKKAAREAEGSSWQHVARGILARIATSENELGIRGTR